MTSIQRKLEYEPPLERLLVNLKLTHRSGRGPVPGVGLQSLQEDEEGDGQVRHDK